MTPLDKEEIYAGDFKTAGKTWEESLVLPKAKVKEFIKR